YRRCQSGGSWRDRLAELEADLAPPQRRAELARAFGVTAPERTEVLEQLSAYGPLPEEELVGLIPDAARVAAVLRWADQLRLADLGDDGWRLDPVLAGLLQPTEG